MQNLEWFDSLNKPYLNPPDWVFMPVWSILYAMIILSLFLFLKGGLYKGKRLPLFFFIAQILLNFSWTPVFFGLQNIFAAFLIIFLMYIFIILTIITFYKYSKISALLLIPYLIWVSFAAYLNFAYLVLN